MPSLSITCAVPGAGAGAVPVHYEQREVENVLAKMNIGASGGVCPCQEVVGVTIRVGLLYPFLEFSNARPAWLVSQASFALGLKRLHTRIQRPQFVRGRRGRG